MIYNQKLYSSVWDREKIHALSDTRASRKPHTKDYGHHQLQYIHILKNFTETQKSKLSCKKNNVFTSACQCQWIPIIVWFDIELCALFGIVVWIEHVQYCVCYWGIILLVWL